MPVRRSDFQEDYVQIGSNQKVDYISMLDTDNADTKPEEFPTEILALKNKRAVNMNADELKNSLKSLVDLKVDKLEAHR